MIKISLKGLANYMTASPTRQRRILRDFKYPDPAGAAQALYYREARDWIAAYHAKKRPAGWLSQRANDLVKLASLARGRTATRLRHNARALREYEQHFGDKAYEVLSDVNLELVHGNVRVTVFPDLHVRENGRVKLLKLEFSVKAPPKQIVKIISQAIYEALRKSGRKLSPSAALYVDIPRGKVHKGARLGARMARDIDSACQNIAAIWPTL